MVKKINKKIVIILILFLAFNFICVNNSFATSLGEMISQAEDFIEEGKSTSVSATDIAKPFVGLGQMLTLVGMGVMIAVTTFMGIKYLTASPEGQAKLKEQLIGLVVAAIVIFGAYYIWSMVLDVVSKFD